MTAAIKTKPAELSSTKAEKPAPVAPGPKTLKEAAPLGVVKLVRRRKNGTLRSLPYLAPGTTRARTPRPWSRAAPRARRSTPLLKT